LFVTAHDAMHGSVCPNCPSANRVTGIIALLLYGLLPYQTLRLTHFQHHRHPASSQDPDFHQNQRSHIFHWYFDFFWSHKCNWSILGLAVVYLILHYFLEISHINLILFWIMPSLLSSFQLFYFGTYLAHKEPLGGYKNSHRTQTIERSFLWSLISCYHFGYHDEHHQYPQVPWWLLRHWSRSLTCQLESI
jgi:beta-carotene/zeaxanthin 4-ketolase